MALIDVYNLAANASFKNRISAAVAKASYDILNEDPATEYHAERVVWAKASMKDPTTITDQMVWTVVQNASIQITRLDSSDNDIQFVVNSNINNFAL